MKSLVAIVIVLLAGGLGLGLCRFVQWRLRVVPGTAVSAAFAPDAVLLLDHTSIGGGSRPNGEVAQETGNAQRLEAIDPKTGAQLAVELTDYKRCWPAGARVWCADIYDRLDLLEPRTLAVLARSTTLIEKAGLAKPLRRAMISGTDAIIHLDDGRGARISPDLKVTLVEAVSEDVLFGMRPQTCATVHDLRAGTLTYKFRGDGARQRLTTYPAPPVEAEATRGAPLTFLEPRFLATSEAMLVLSRASVGGPHLLTRVDGITKERWRVPLGGACQSFAIHDGTLFVASDAADRRALAIDLANGAVRWTYGRE